MRVNAVALGFESQVSGVDYAALFETVDGNSIDVSYSVTLKYEK